MTTTPRKSAAALVVILLGAGLSALAVVSAASPATAHTGTLPDSNYYNSTITSVTPAVSGLDFSLVKNGESITLTNHTGQTVVVLGYTGEDYLRITPTGVDENVNSLSSFLNGSLIISGLPEENGQGSGTKLPEWKHVSNQPSYTWHDHRMHWMATQRPPVVAANPRVPHTVFDWAMNLTVGGDPVVVKGTLRWIGAPPVSGKTLALIVTIGTVALAIGGLIAVRVGLRRRSAQAPGSEERVDAPVPG
jgi:hypothetical protein